MVLLRGARDARFLAMNFTSQVLSPPSLRCKRCASAAPAKVVRLHRTFDVGTDEPLRIDVSTAACGTCGHLVDARAVDEAATRAAIRAIVDAGLANGRTFRFLRDAVGLQAKELGALIFSGIGTISRWENAHRVPDRRAWALLACLASDAVGDGRRGSVRAVLDALLHPSPIRPAHVAVGLHGSDATPRAQRS